MRRRFVTLTLAAVTALGAAGCTGSGRPPASVAEEKPLASNAPLDARTQLAGLAATAKDRRYMAGYTWTPPGRSPRTVVATLAVDGSWRVDIPGGALGGQANVAMAGTRTGLYQCRLGGQRSCVRIAAPDGEVPPEVDPRVQHPFADWIDELTDRKAALSVVPAPLLPGARGACFSVEANTASLDPPVDPGIYCYDVDGTLTAVRATFGTLLLATAAAPAPPTVTLPGPVTGGSGLSTAAPPPPPSPSARPAAAPAHRRAVTPAQHR
jgi:hypothetical protein